MVYLLWFVQRKAEGEDTELLIGAYSSEAEARTAIQRLKDKPGFAALQEGFQISPRQLNRDHWTESFIVD